MRFKLSAGLAFLVRELRLDGQAVRPVALRDLGIVQTAHHALGQVLKIRLEYFPGNDLFFLFPFFSSLADQADN